MHHLHFGQEQLAAIRKHGEASYPHECCGFILGRQKDESLVATELIPAQNTRTDSAHNRYSISPLEYLQTEKLADSRGLQIIGFYHSHPDHPAVPSQYDLDHAWPNLAYVIVEVRERQARDLFAYLLAKDRSRFDKIDLIES